MVTRLSRKTSSLWLLVVVLALGVAIQTLLSNSASDREANAAVQRQKSEAIREGQEAVRRIFPAELQPVMMEVEAEIFSVE